MNSHISIKSLTILAMRLNLRSLRPAREMTIRTKLRRKEGSIRRLALSLKLSKRTKRKMGLLWKKQRALMAVTTNNHQKKPSKRPPARIMKRRVKPTSMLRPCSSSINSTQTFSGFKK